jgi:Spy/CpxP family protein refolding chaperone
MKTTVSTCVAIALLLAIPAFASYYKDAPSSKIPTSEQVISDAVSARARTHLLAQMPPGAGKEERQGKPPVSSKHGPHGFPDFGQPSIPPPPGSCPGPGAGPGPGCGPGPSPFMCGPGFAGPGPGPGGFMHGLNLSDEQSEKLMLMHDQMEEKVAAKRAELMSLHHKMALALFEATVDKSKVMGIQDRINQLQTELAGIGVNFALDFSELLTAEQRKQMRQMSVKGGPGPCGPPPPPAGH